MFTLSQQAVEQQKKTVYLVVARATAGKKILGKGGSRLRLTLLAADKSGLGNAPESLPSK